MAAKPKRPKLPHGRPSKYTPEVADEIISRLSLGETLTRICRDAHIPERMTVWRWEEAHPEFSIRLRGARLKQADSLFDELQEIPDQPLTNTRTREELERRKMQVDVRKFRVARLNRALYGDKQEVKHTGDATEPVAVSTSNASVDVLTPEEQAQLRELSRKMLQGKPSGEG